MEAGYRKNDIVTLRITDMSNKGEGIGRVSGYTLFVKDAVIGDTVEAQIVKVGKTYGYGRLRQVLTPSPDRVQAPCPCARQCGGCQLQALSYQAQLRFKENMICNHLSRIGGLTDIPMEPIIGMEQPYRYRNKAQFPVGVSRDGEIVAGFYAGRTHSIIPNRDCLLGATINEEILNRMISYMRDNHVPPYDEKTGKGLVRYVLIRTGFVSGQILVCLIINGETIPHPQQLIRSLRRIEGMAGITLNSNRQRSNVILGRDDQTLWGQSCIEDSIDGIRFRVSPHSFYQVNPAQTIHMYEKVLEYAQLTGRETVWDLYCGIGTITLFLAKHAASVYGVEVVPEAIADARRNARLNQIENVHFLEGKAEKIVPEKYQAEGIHADVVVVDPPRKGCEEKLLSTITAMQPARIIYVSCNSATLARDVKLLTGQGYRVERVCPVDNFPQTVHCETILALTKT